MAGRLQGTLEITTLDCTELIPPAGFLTNTHVAASAAIARSKLAQDDLKAYQVPLIGARVWDAVATNLPGTSANDDLGIEEGTWGTNPLYITSGDVKAGGCTRYALFEIPLPAEYVDGQTVQIRVTAGMQTTVSDGAAEVDLEVYESTGASSTGISADLCATAATSFKNLTAADKDFTITATDLVAGDMLLARLKMAITDAATGTAVIGNVYRIQLLCDVKG
jgi:hypothetical protein